MHLDNANTSAADAPVLVELASDWHSGSATVRVDIRFGAHSLDEALALIKRATDGAPLFHNPSEEAQ